MDAFKSSTSNRIITLQPELSPVGSSIERRATERLFRPSAEVLTSQAIPAEAWDALEDGDRLGFLRLRAAQLEAVLEGFLSAKL